jgi:hypothetical protein
VLLDPLAEDADPQHLEAAAALAERLEGLGLDLPLAAVRAACEEHPAGAAAEQFAALATTLDGRWSPDQRGVLGERLKDLLALLEEEGGAGALAAAAAAVRDSLAVTRAAQAEGG